MQEAREFIEENKQLYKKMLSNQAFDLLFSNKKLSTAQVRLLAKHVAEDVTDNIPKIADTSTINHCTSLFNGIFTRFISAITGDNGYIKIAATANNVYVESNTTSKLIGKTNISIIRQMLFYNMDVVVLSEKNIVTHIGVVKDNMIQWGKNVFISKGIYVKCTEPSEEITNAVISKVILSNLNGE